MIFHRKLQIKEIMYPITDALLDGSLDVQLMRNSYSIGAKHLAASSIMAPHSNDSIW